jgi:hypothetical protein
VTAEQLGGDGPQAGRLSRSLAAGAAIAAALLAIAWALIAFDYATGDASLRGGEDRDLQLTQAAIAAIGIAGALCAVVAGSRHARTGDRSARRWHVGGLGLMLLALPPWMAIVFILSSD